MTDSSLTLPFAQRFTLTLHGKGAHAARPHEGLDTIVTGSHIIAALSTLTPAGVSVTRFQAGNSWNVLPPEAQIEGVLHAKEADTQQQASTLIKTIAQAFGVQAELAWQPVTERQSDPWFSSP